MSHKTAQTDAFWQNFVAHAEGRRPITVRFSNFAGILTIPDTDGLATPRGMATLRALSPFA
jgi:hypothetical protein